jgi:hypothetical protein
MSPTANDPARAHNHIGLAGRAPHTSGAGMYFMKLPNRSGELIIADNTTANSVT